jgi:DNA polymerase bacteriophage-type
MFAVADLIFIDFETYGALDLTEVGSIRYTTHDCTRSLAVAYAVGDSEVRTWDAGGEILDWAHCPDDLRGAFDGGRILAAWNAAFDSAVWNYATVNFPFLPPERIIDPSIQVAVSNLPTDLQSASKALGGPGKQEGGKKLVGLFSIEGAAPHDHPAEWQQFLSYARRDVEAMRHAYRSTRLLPLKDWREYWCFEHVNRRGVHVDTQFIERAAALAIEDSVAIGHRLVTLTEGAVDRVTKAKKLAGWLYDQISDADMRAALTVDTPDDEEDPGDDADDPGPPELSVTRDRVAKILALLETKRANGGLTPAETAAREAAELRIFGAGASPKKFARLACQHHGGLLCDQYRFCGAGQTGRLSSKGAQIQNLSRDVLGPDGADEAALVDLIADGATYAEVAAAAPTDVPVSRKLALLVRPALIADPGKILVWSDWSAIEARVTPWLANSPGGEKVLDIFRANDLDPTRPDIYTVAAAGILHKDPSQITKVERSVGKVAVLALGFGGSIKALKTMALAYRVDFNDAEARRTVDSWRASNPWAPEFWGRHRDGESFGLWGAAMTAIESPGLVTEAGRIGFVYWANYLGGSLLMILPSGRVLTYPRPRWRETEILDANGNPTGQRRREMSFQRARGRVRLWHGTFAENSTQAVAADILRETVTRIETDPDLAWMRVRMTCHDEIVVEVAEARAAEAQRVLRAEMLCAPAWAGHLPLQSEESTCYYYTKAKSALHKQ